MDQEDTDKTLQLPKCHETCNTKGMGHQPYHMLHPPNCIDRFSGHTKCLSKLGWWMESQGHGRRHHHAKRLWRHQKKSNPSHCCLPVEESFDDHPYSTLVKSFLTMPTPGSSKPTTTRRALAFWPLLTSAGDHLVLHFSMTGIHRQRITADSGIFPLATLRTVECFSQAPIFLMFCNSHTKLVCTFEGT